MGALLPIYAEVSKMPDNVEAKSKRDTPEKDHSLYPHTGIEGIDRIGLLREQAAKMQTPKSDSGLPSISLHSDHPSDLKTAAGDSTGNQKAGKTYEFDHLDNRAANHHSADAVAYLSKNFDSSKPINLLVYYHGYGSNAESATRDNNLKQQLEKAPPNTMLLVPEWQQNPGARSGAQGHFSETGRFDKMLQEVIRMLLEAYYEPNRHSCALGRI